MTGPVELRADRGIYRVKMFLSLLLSSLMLQLTVLAAEPLNKTICYGLDFYISPSRLGDPQNLYFTSAVPGSPRVQVLRNKTSLDPRYELSRWFYVRETTDNDTGSFSVGDHLGTTKTVLILEVEDCSDEIFLDYGADHALPLRSLPPTHWLEFRPLERPQGVARVLWRRAGSPAGVPTLPGQRNRGRMEFDHWKMTAVTQEDSGFYVYRSQERRFIGRSKITVREHYQHVNDRAAGQDFQIQFGMNPSLFNLTFSSPFSRPPDQKGAPPPLLLLREGVPTQTQDQFTGRLFLRNEDQGRPTLSLTVNHIRKEDSGSYELRDQRGNLALLVDLFVKEPNVRLVGGRRSHCSGQLEVKRGSEWRPAGDPHRRWSIRSAAAVCQQLGCGSAVSTLRTSGALQLIWRVPDPVQSKTKSSPSEEREEIPLEDDQCSTRLEVECAGYVRLVNGPSLCSGRVEVQQTSGGSWSGVCEGDLDVVAGGVLCRELGCGSTAVLQGGGLYGGAGGASIGKLHCDGTEVDLRRCRRDDQTGLQNSCSANSTVALHCSDPDDVRLVGGTSECSGILEIKQQEEWRPVVLVEEEDEVSRRKSLSSVLCRTMSCGYLVSSGRRSAAAPRPVWKINPTCSGREDSLRECHGGAAESGESASALLVKCDYTRRRTQEMKQQFLLANGDMD